MLTTVIIDDEAESRIAARTALKNFQDVQVIGEYEGSQSFFTALSAGADAPDLAFLDIEFDGENGFTIADLLKEHCPKTAVIFLTGHSSYAVDSFDFQPLYFLTKPIQQDKLERALELARNHFSAKESPAEPLDVKIMFRMHQGYRMINVSDICYIERYDRKNYLYLESETLRISNYTMHELEVMLEKYGFFLCHQSFLISLRRVAAVQEIKKQIYEVSLYGAKKPVPVARGRYEELRHLLTKYSS